MKKTINKYITTRAIVEILIILVLGAAIVAVVSIVIGEHRDQKWKRGEEACASLSKEMRVGAKYSRELEECLFETSSGSFLPRDMYRGNDGYK